jgi:hypothetical protein
MDVSRLASALIAAAALTVTPATRIAQATTSDPGPGVLCDMTSTTDPNTEGGTTQFGEIHAGPLMLVDDSGAPGSGTLACTVQVGESTHVGTDQAGAAAHGTGVVVLAPSIISYESPTGVAVYVCTSYIDDDGVTVLYWNSNGGFWTTSPNAACRQVQTTSGGGGILTCTLDLVDSIGNRPFPGTPFETIDYTVATAFDGVDYVICVVI